MAGKGELKTGGRIAGTPNKQTQEIIEKLTELDCDPIEGMVQIAKQAEDESNLNLAGQMYKELAQYVAPKRKSIEMAISHGNKGLISMTDEELLAIASSIKQ